MEPGQTGWFDWFRTELAGSEASFANLKKKKQKNI